MTCHRCKAEVKGVMVHVSFPPLNCQECPPERTLCPHATILLCTPCHKSYKAALVEFSRSWLREEAPTLTQCRAELGVQESSPAD